MGLKIRLGCFGLAVLLLIAASVFHRPVLRRLFDDAYVKTTERVVLALPAGERTEAERLCVALHECFKTEGVDEAFADEIQVFREASFDMLKDQEVTTDEAREHVDRVRTLLESVYPEAWSALGGRP